MSVIKRQREARKRDKAALKRERREQTERSEDPSKVATRDELADYGVSPDPRADVDDDR